MTDFAKYIDAVNDTVVMRSVGHVTAIHDMVIESEGPRAVIGEVCDIYFHDSQKSVTAEVVAMSGTKLQLMAFDEFVGLEIGCDVVATGTVLSVPVGFSLLGRVLNGVGKPVDGLGEIAPETYYPALASPPPAYERPEISRRISTGIRAIDGILTMGEGQRVGIFAGSGVGKSTLLSMIARNTSADINVIALIGERGRELNDFLNRDLGPEGLKRSVIVVATGDQTPLSKVRGAYTATAIAEFFRDQGKSVMLMVDSITRFAKAKREIGVATGEPSVKGGYTPGVFSDMQRLLERAGTCKKGSITAIYTVLVDGDDFDEPVSDTARGTLDGHFVLSRELSERAHYPAIDMQHSISRLQNRITGSQTKKARKILVKNMAVYRENADMINVGAYKKGASAEIDAAIAMHSAIEEFLQQEEDDKAPYADTLAKMAVVAGVEIPEEEAL